MVAGALAVGCLLVVGVLAWPVNTVRRTAGAQPLPSQAVAMRLDKPEKFLSGWPESKSRKWRRTAQQSVGALKTLLDGEATSAVATAYTTADEQYTAVVSGVSGKVADPTAALDRIFATLPRLSEVKPTRPGPMGGEARCGKGQDQGIWINTCVWSDDHSIGIVAFIGFPQTGDPDDMFVRARSQLEHPVA
jgi:hypothetical protein